MKSKLMALIVGLLTIVCVNAQSGKDWWSTVHLAQGAALYVDGQLITKDIEVSKGSSKLYIEVFDGSTNPKGTNLTSKTHQPLEGTYIVEGNLNLETLHTQKKTDIYVYDTLRVDNLIVNHDTKPVALPIKLNSFKQVGHKLVWDLGALNNLDSLMLQATNTLDDSDSWKTIENLPVDSTEYPMGMGIVVIGSFLTLSMTKRKWLMIIGIGILAMTFYGCSKSDSISTPETYKYYRLKICPNNSDPIYSTTLTYKS